MAEVLLDHRKCKIDSGAGAPLLAFMIGNAVGSVRFGHAADRIAAIDRALIVLCIGRVALIAMLMPPIARNLGLVLVIADFAVLGLIAGGTVPLVLKCTKRLYTAEFIGVGASVNTTAAGIFGAIAQPIIGLSMIAASQIVSPLEDAQAALDDTSYEALIILLAVLSLPGIIGPSMMRKEVRN